MRIKTDGQYEWRNDQYEEAADLLGERTKSKGIDTATEFTIEMISNLEEAIEHPDMAEELADIISTEAVSLTYEVETGIDVEDE